MIRTYVWKEPSSALPVMQEKPPNIDPKIGVFSPAETLALSVCQPGHWALVLSREMVNGRAVDLQRWVGSGSCTLIPDLDVSDCDED